MPKYIFQTLGDDGRFHTKGVYGNWTEADAEMKRHVRIMPNCPAQILLQFAIVEYGGRNPKRDA